MLWEATAPQHPARPPSARSDASFRAPNMQHELRGSQRVSPAPLRLRRGGEVTRAAMAQPQECQLETSRRFFCTGPASMRVARSRPRTG